MKASRAIRALEDLKGEAAADPSIFVDGPSHTAWRAKIQSVLSTSMGSDNATTTAFRNLSYYIGVYGGGPDESAEDAEHFREAVERGIALIDAAILALNIEADDDLAVLQLPRPEGHEQEALVGVIWGWWKRRSAWPTYSQVLRAYDQRADGDCLDPWRELPDGLVIPSSPPSIPSPTMPMSLTLAGAIACGFSDTPLTTFVAMVRLANQRWRSIDLDADEETVQVTSVDAEAAAGAEQLSTAELALIGSFLGSEPLGLGSSSQLDGAWTMTFREGIRRYRSINNVADYWRCRTEVLADTHQAGSSWPTPAPVHLGPGVSMFDVDLWEYVEHAVAVGAWSAVASLAMTFFEDTVRRRGGSPQARGGGTLYGKDLLIKALASDGPLPLAENGNEIEGWRSLGQGLVAATGNVDRHHIQKRDDLRQYAFGVLGTVSLILTQIKHKHGPATAVADTAG